ncbi:hypothetical protein E4U13_007748 [Claviceps humidiphila]|uniref:Uncharacterized protein n=1 Tax=Claviceps humidiphila TaxID=1294629 RepID=A0A9P7QCP9_9HYPO|nr:hypothetical protein E4U13_007748 [Claviceps humidiphila]
MHVKSLLSICLISQAALVVAQTSTTETGSAASRSALPPSPTGSGVCEPHGDHWHCHAATSTDTGSVVDTVSASATAASCVPHNDHWHCPSGITKPSTPPAQTQSGAKSTTSDIDDDDDDDDDDDHEDHHHDTSKGCTPHNDHWHCPSGVSAPTTPPAQTQSGTKPSASSASSDGNHHGTDKECTPHEDHWHCPSGVLAPSTPPTAGMTTPAAKSSNAATSTAAGAATSSAAQALAGGRVTGATGSVGLAIAASWMGAFLFGIMMV